MIEALVFVVVCLAVTALAIYRRRDIEIEF